MLDPAHRWTLEIECPDCGATLPIPVVNETGPAYYHGPRVEVEAMPDACTCGCSWERLERAAYDRMAQC